MSTTKNVIKTKVEKPLINPKKTQRTKKPIPVKFDKEGFYMAWGIGIVTTVIGILIIWATKTAPKGVGESTGFTTSQRLAHLLPQSTKETLAFIIGALFVIFGVFMLFLGLKLAIKYFIDKSKSPS